MGYGNNYVHEQKVDADKPARYEENVPWHFPRRRNPCRRPPLSNMDSKALHLSICKASQVLQLRTLQRLVAACDDSACMSGDCIREVASSFLIFAYKLDEQR